MALDSLRAWVHEILSPEFRCPECRTPLIKLADPIRYIVNGNIVCSRCYVIEMKKQYTPPA